VRLERLVLATDFTDAARGALEHAVALAARFQARLYVFHAIDIQDGDGAHVAGNEHRADEFYELAEKQARAELEAVRGRLAVPGVVPDPIPIVESVRLGSPVDEIVRFATEKKADLIVVGTHGRTGLRRVLAGSTAEGVARQAPCPVLVVRSSAPAARKAGGPEPDATAPRAAPSGALEGFATVVCAVDASASSRAALRAACGIADRFDGRVIVLGVIDEYLMAQAATASQVDTVALESRFVEIARSQLDRAIEESVGGRGDRRRPEGFLERRVQAGRPAETVVRVATQEKAGLVACGTHGRSGLARALFGSVAERIVRLAPCPVLTVREGRPAARVAA
jgi:nucleotide-binding universal stress UspA family protein